MKINLHYLETIFSTTFKTFPVAAQPLCAAITVFVLGHLVTVFLAWAQKSFGQLNWAELDCSYGFVCEERLHDKALYEYVDKSLFPNHIFLRFNFNKLFLTPTKISKYANCELSERRIVVQDFNISSIKQFSMFNKYGSSSCLFGYYEDTIAFIHVTLRGAIHK